MGRLENIYCFIISDNTGDGLLTLRAENEDKSQNIFLPLATPFKKDLPNMESVARGIGQKIGKRVTLVRFTGRATLRELN